MPGFNSVYLFLKSPRSALACGFGATFLLVLGSFVMNFNPGDYSLLQGEDISFFFREFKILHSWFYLLVAVFVLLGVNGLVCTIDSLWQLIKSKIKQLSSYGPVAMHLGFLMALLGHLIAGLGSFSSPHVMVGREWVNLDNTKVKLVSVDYSSFPNGMPKTADLRMQLKYNSEIREVKLGFNHPYIWEKGTKLLLFHRLGPVPEGVWIKVNGKETSIFLEEINKIAGVQLKLDQIFLPPSFRRPVAALSVSKDGNDWKSIIVPIGVDHKLPHTKESVRFYNVITSQGVMVSIKTNPSIFLVLVAMLVFLLGIILVIQGRLKNA